ncbi:hypothetical protein FQN54_008776 [Arachnomyces sp. PD_36]|nr:hypothetical protein FQN54_008776 [Arachnomyces sp. PD_36]
MGTALDALNPHLHASQPPLTARRPAASNLPTFELPPPPSHLPSGPSSSHKYASSSSSANPINAIASQPSPANVSVGNLLTPPTNPSVDTTQPLPSYSPSTGYWQPSPTAYGMPSGSAAPQPWNQNMNPLFPPRNQYSPSLVRNTPQQPTTDTMPQPYDINQQPSFHATLPVSSPANVPTTAVQQQQQQAMAHHQAYMRSQNDPTSPGPPPPQLDSSSMNPYDPKQPPAPIFSGSSQPTTPQQGSFPTGYIGTSSVHQSGLPTRMGSISGQSPMQTQMQQFPRPPYPSYSLPAMTGPIMTNVHSPGGQMSMMGSLPQPGLVPGPTFNSGHAAMHQQHLYGHPHSLGPPPGHMHQGPPNDRPFKCDQCPQSFNRNHDLKRHRRIHLEVKPFPCAHCVKSFSRKDALKRHILVKRCGGGGEQTGETATTSSSSPGSGSTAAPTKPGDNNNGSNNSMSGGGASHHANNNDNLGRSSGINGHI